MHIRALAAVLAVPMTFAGCGGGGSGGSDTVTLSATADLSGHASAAGDYFSTGGSLFIGDLISGHGFGEEGIRGFLSFDLSSIPLGAQVISATLRVTQEIVNSGVYPSLGSLVVDQTVYGTALDPGAYDRAYPINQGFATLSTDDSLGDKFADVTAAVADDLANQHMQSQFRLRFSVETNLNGEGNQVILSDVSPSAPDEPVLVVEYRR